MFEIELYEDSSGESDVQAFLDELLSKENSENTSKGD